MKKEITTKRIIEVFTENELNPDKIADEIKLIAMAMNAALSSNLSDRALILLIWDSMPVYKRPSRKTIEAVLQAAANLDNYLKDSIKDI